MSWMSWAEVCAYNDEEDIKMGKKYIIELCEKPMKNENGDDIWRVKGFHTLVFDQNGLDKLEEYKEPEKETHELKVGDVCYLPKEHGNEKLIVTKIGPCGISYMESDGTLHAWLTKEFTEKAVFLYHSDLFEAFLKGDFT